MSTLTLLRHGQALFGASDYDALSDIGMEQAQATARYFAERGIVFDRILCGSLRRQRQTAEAVFALQSASGAQVREIEVVPALDEFADPADILAAAETAYGVPVHSDPQTPREVRLRHYNTLIQDWAKGSARIGDKPDASVFRAATGRWLDDMTLSAPGANGPKSARILAVTSAGVIGACLAHLLGLPDRYIAEAAAVLGNCSLTEVVYSSKRRSLLGFNTTAHLPAALVSGI
jgi:broad specificity phosphatase PhoE